MQKELKDFYKKINNGKIRGVRKIIADALEIDETAVSKWNSGETKPSQENIEKMAKIFKISKEEINKIFVSNVKSLEYKNKNELDFYKKELAIRDQMIDLLNHKILSIEEKNKKLEKENLELRLKLKEKK